MIRRGSDVQGYLFGRHGHNREHLGPLVADCPDTAAALLDSILAEQPDRRFYLDVPDDRQEWRDVISGIGFAIERPFLRMHRGRLDDARRPVLDICDRRAGIRLTGFSDRRFWRYPATPSRS